MTSSTTSSLTDQGAQQLAAPAAEPRAVSTVVAVLSLLAVTATAGVINFAVSRAGWALGVPAQFPDFDPAIFLPATVVGVLAGTLGWLLVRRVSRRPARTLRVVVPLVSLLSFAPDLALLITRGQPGTTPLGVGCLMIMHLVIIALTVPVLARVFPPR